MLFKIKDLQRIKSGAISLAYRKWKKPSVKKGTLLKTAIGQVEILNISPIDLESISNTDAIKAGYEDLEELIATLNKRKEGILYKINLQYHSPDPRIKIREQTSLNEDEIQFILEKLARLDKYSKSGEWTTRVLTAIAQNPQLRALDLAKKLNVEKDWLKPNVRKLKNIGLTISHGVGYSLSPLGFLIFNKLKQNK